MSLAARGAAACLALLAAALPLALSAAEPPDAGALEPQEMAPGIFVLAHADRLGSANAGWIACDDGALLVGAPAAEAVPRLLALAERTAGKPVREAVFTQGGEGEVGAARLLAAQGIGLYAAPEAAAALRAGGLPAAARLDEVAGRRRLEGVKRTASRTLELVPLGHASRPGA